MFAKNQGTGARCANRGSQGMPGGTRGGTKAQEERGRLEVLEACIMRTSHLLQDLREAQHSSMAASKKQQHRTASTTTNQATHPQPSSSPAPCGPISYFSVFNGKFSDNHQKTNRNPLQDRGTHRGAGPVQNPPAFVAVPAPRNAFVINGPKDRGKLMGLDEVYIPGARYSPAAQPPYSSPQ